jgi:hypothetical protein
VPQQITTVTIKINRRDNSLMNDTQFHGDNDDGGEPITLTLAELCKAKAALNAILSRVIGAL